MDLTDDLDNHELHPEGECSEDVAVDGLGGRIHVRWDRQAPVTAMGQMAFFAEFLRSWNGFDSWVDGCPLSFTSPNAPHKRDLLGTMVLSILAGHWRYAHISSIRCDGVSPGLLGMARVMSEDSVRRAFKDQDPRSCEQWMHEHLRRCWEPLLSCPWVLDLDTTVKTIYGRQEGAKIGYNPHKRKRPSHMYNAMIAMPMRVVLDVEVHPGNHVCAAHMTPRVWRLVDGLQADQRPWLIRGDCMYGTDAVMLETERRKMAYLLRIRQTANVQRLIKQLFAHGTWVKIDSQCDAAEAMLKLMGWQCERRVVVVRRRIEDNVAMMGKADQQLQLFDRHNSIAYEYVVLVTNLEHDVNTLAELYRDRGACENVFDELKNQWCWSGFVTKDLLRCQVMARIAALVYNWWTLFARLVVGGHHREAVTTRPLLLYAMGKQTDHGRQRTLTITATHSKGSQIKSLLLAVHQFLTSMIATAEQLNPADCWKRIVARILEPLTPQNWIKMPEALPIAPT